MLRDGKSPGRGRRETPNTTDIAKRRIGRETGCEKSPASHEQLRRFVILNDRLHFLNKSLQTSRKLYPWDGPFPIGYMWLTPDYFYM